MTPTLERWLGWLWNPSTGPGWLCWLITVTAMARLTELTVRWARWARKHRHAHG